MSLKRLPALLFAMAALSATAEEEISAGRKHSCVPNADRSGWECKQSGTAAVNGETASASAEATTADPAPVTSAPELRASDDTQPATMLTAPSEPVGAVDAEPDTEAEPISDFYRLAPEHEPIVNTIDETPLPEPEVIDTPSTPDPRATETVSAPAMNTESASPPAAEPTASASETVAIEQPTEAAAETTPAVMATEPAPAANEAAATAVASEPEPLPDAAAPVISEPVVSEPAVSQPTESAPLETDAPMRAEPVVAEVASVPVQPISGRIKVLDLAGAREFARLDPNAYTLQLADGASNLHFPALIEALRLPPKSVYLLRVKRDGADWWLLAYGAYADANQAKRALSALPNAPGLTRNWPRKILYLQREYQPFVP